MDILGKAIELNGKQATIINTNAEVVLKQVDDSYKDSVNFNYLFTYAAIGQGNLVTIDDVTYIVIEKENNLVDTYNKATITKTQPIIYKDKEILGYIRSLTDSIDKTEYFNILANKLEVTIPENKEISINDMISYKNSDFKIISIDNTKEGLLTFVAEFEKKAEPIVYSIVAPKELTLTVGDTKEIEVVAKKNNVIDSKPTLIYKVNDDSICTIENNIVTALKEGKATITITYNNVSTEINVIVKAKEVVPPKEPEDPKEDFSGTFTLNCPEHLKIGETTTITLDPPRKTVVYKLTDSDGIGEIVSQGNGECVVKALAMDYITVVALSPSGTKLTEGYIYGFK
ncbi:hypothetical protein [Clostridium baratii]|uniref:hypothetical protein n=1 Tax=Clostridium baratii TaxID=1561 RepID=UPI002942B88D|nr:hypothetical protein [Clostridium baratii]